jgi:hypothetical protein
MVVLVRQVQQVLQVHKEQQVLQAHKEQQVPLVLLVTMVQLEQLVLLDM